MADLAVKCESCGATILTDTTKNTYKCDFCNTYHTRTVDNTITPNSTSITDSSLDYKLIMHSYINEENTVKAYMDLMNCNFHDAYNSLRNLPIIITSGVTKEKAMNVAGKFYNAGCVFDITSETTTVIPTIPINATPTVVVDINVILKNIFIQYKTTESYSTRVGINLEKSDKKFYPKAVLSFNIPSGEQIYYIKDATLFGFLKKGFAIASSGIYYRTDDGLEGFLSWDDYMTLDIIMLKSELVIGNLRFIIGIPQETFDLLKYLQLAINNTIKA
jgi:hypothetical protein